MKVNNSNNQMTEQIIKPMNPEAVNFITLNGYKFDVDTGFEINV